MAWIKVIEEDEAEGELRKRYDKFTGPWGGVDNILKIHSLRPATLDGHFALYKAVMTGSRDLSKAQREMIAVTVSALNQCVY
jgi:uncharacterized peroxidase-related enzyme